MLMNKRQSSASVEPDTSLLYSFTGPFLNFYDIFTDNYLVLQHWTQMKSFHVLH